MFSSLKHWMLVFPHRCVSHRPVQGPLLFALVAGVGVLSLGCKGSEAAAQGEPSALCQWVEPDLANGGCTVDPWATLATWRTSQTRVETSYLNISIVGDPVRVAALQAQQGFRAPGREELSAWPLTIPVSWNADPFRDSNWRFQLHAWRMLDPLLLAWTETGEQRYVDDAMRIVEDWHRYHVENGRHSAYGWNGMATGIRAMKIALLLDRSLRGEMDFSEGDKELTIELADAHVRKLVVPALLNQGNHGLFQLHGLIAICTTVPQLVSCRGALQYAEQAMQRLLNLQFSSEGIHLEHSPDYHVFITDTVRLMFRSGWYDSFEQVRELLNKAEANEAWLFHPDGHVAAVGDSTPGAATASFPRGDGSCVDIASRDTTRCYLLREFPLSGYAVVRSDWAIPKQSASQLFFVAAYHSWLHKHSDDLSFELFEFGERVLTDSGKYGYNDDAWRQFVLSTRAHNALEVNGLDTVRSGENAYGSALKSSKRRESIFILEGEIGHVASGALQRRRLYYEPRKWLLVVDALSGGTVSSATQWFHFAPQVLVSRLPGNAAGTFQAALGGGRTIQVEQLIPGCPGSLTTGGSNPIQGWSTQSYGRMVPRFALAFQCEGSARWYATLFLLDPSQRADIMTNVSIILSELGLR